MISIPPTIAWIAIVILALLLIANVIIDIWANRHGLAHNHELRQRLRTWWVIVTVIGTAATLGNTAMLYLFAAISFLALRELFVLLPKEQIDRKLLALAYIAIPIQYYWISIGWYVMFVTFIPIYLFLLFPTQKIITGNSKGFLQSIPIVQWGLMLTVFGLSHAAYLLALPQEEAPEKGLELLLFLIILTELNDVAQYLWGKAIGKRKVLPNISPGKTWGGLIGGVLTTIFLAGIFAPWLTPLHGYEAIGAGLLIGVSGFIGDTTISAVKRDLSVKDSGNLLPGHGGILDRVDSLTYTAPLFFYYVYFLKFQ